MNDTDEATRLMAWRQGIIDALGEDLRGIVQLIADDHDESWSTLAYLCQRFNVPAIKRSGMRLYWLQLRNDRRALREREGRADAQ